MNKGDEKETNQPTKKGDKKMKKVITFRTETQKLLFEKELKGQISDGYWENAGPRDHWLDWCDTDVVVGDKVGVNFYSIKNNYSFTAKALLDVVGERMRKMAEVKLYFPNLPNDECKILGEYKLSWLLSRTNPYWKNYANNILKYVSKEEVLEFESQNDQLYTMEDLRKDLREIKKTIKVFNG